MIFDRNKAMYLTADSSAIRYNHLNLPVNINVSGSQASRNITYVCDARGVKLCKVVVGSANGTTEYTGNYIYENSKLQFFSTPEGYVEPKNPDNLSLGYDYIYQYKDHLGNVRLSYKNVGTTSNVDLEIQEENNYYPFGLKHKGYNGNQSAARNHKYGFGNKEEQDELGLEWMDFGARNYDASIGRWMNVDNASEEYYDFSPYSYSGNTPIIAGDPTGERIAILGDDDFRGQVLYQLILSARSKAGFERLSNAIESENTLVIQAGNGDNAVYGRRANGDGPEGDGTYTSFLDFNPTDDQQTDDVVSSPSDILVHELDHFTNDNPNKTFPFYTGRQIKDNNSGKSYPDSFPWSEFSAVRAGNEHRAALGKEVRRNYDGVNIFNKEPSTKIGGKLVPSSKPFIKEDYRGNIMGYGTINKYLLGSSSQTIRPNAKFTNKNSAKGGNINKMRVQLLSKKSE